MRRSFRNPRLKYRVARRLAGELPPGPGRPGLPAVTKAYRMLEELRRLHPGEAARILWRIVYPEAIEGYDSLSLPERRAARQELRDRVRRRAGRQTARKIKA